MLRRGQSGLGGVVFVAIIKCPQCNKKLPRRAKTCPNCGFNVTRYLPIKEDEEWTREERLGNKVGKVFGSIIGVIIIIILLIKLGLYDWISEHWPG